MEKSLSKDKSSERGSIFVSRKNIANFAIGILGFFIGRVVLFEGLNPLAIAFLFNFAGINHVFYITAILTGVGLATELEGLFLIKYVICLTIACISNFVIYQKDLKPSVFVKAILSFSSLLVSGIIFSVLNSFDVYFGFLSVLESFLAFFLTYILKNSTEIVMGKSYKKILNTEELISIALLMGAVVSGASDIYIGYVSLRIFFVTLILLTVSYKSGSAESSMASVLLGLMLYISGYLDTNLIIIFSFSAIVCGVLREKGRFKSLLGYIVAEAAIIALLDFRLFVPELIVSSLLGCAVFAVMPDTFYFNITSTINPSSDNAEDYILRIKEITTERLNAFSDAFSKLAKSFSKLSEKRSSLGHNDVSKLIDDIAIKACSNCNIRDYCWSSNFYETYQTIFSILGACDKKGRIELADIPENFRRTCIAIEYFTETANRLFELNRLNLVWNNRIIESRDLVSQQLLGVSNLIKDLSEELDFDVKFNEDIEQSLLNELHKNKIEVESVIVLENKEGKFEISIKHKPCLGKKLCTKNIIQIVSGVAGKKMKLLDSDCSIKNKVCNLRFIESQKYRISSGVSKRTKTESKYSGDSYSFMELKNGQSLLALSDGMGSGEKAKEESTATIELLEDFIESGFEKDLAIKIINSALVLKSNEESFSTLDICSVDLYTGNAEFIKVGASTTFLVRNGVVQILKSTSLPIGILNTIDVEISTRILKPNDMIIMVTDGLTEIEDGLSESSSWIVDFLTKYKSGNPQDVADFIVEEGIRLSDGFIKDDMTVLVSKLWEK